MTFAIYSKLHLPKLEEDILVYWEKHGIFERTLQKTATGTHFVFYEGPPTANGKPHIGHVLARSFKDMFPRYKTMQGYHVLRRAGWDSHGLPVEIEIEKNLGISGKREIERYGIEQFNKLCRASVFRYIDTWKQLTKRMGFWVDLKNPYIVLDNTYIESLWWIIKQTWEKGLLVKDYKVLPYCTRCQTPLSSHELAQGYTETTDPSLYVKFALDTDSTVYKALAAKHGITRIFFVAWTTTPWTLLANVALAVNPQARYVAGATADKSELIIFAENRQHIYTQYTPQETFLGKQLVGTAYTPLFSQSKRTKTSHRLIADTAVFPDEGTGIVHTAAMYGEEDFVRSTTHHLPKQHVVNKEGRFTKDTGPFADQEVHQATKDIVAYLEQNDALLMHETITHTYPFCWRCKSKLIYYALDTWFIQVTKIKDTLIKNNTAINWYPNHIRQGRMNDWLRNGKDWALSRSRYWGTPLPVWKCTDCAAEAVIGSYAELQARAQQTINLHDFDPHRPYIDRITLTCQDCGAQMQRYEDVLDTWFDSGAMPYAQWHYPFENKELFAKQFPADFICEGIDQTRGWFYTLLVEATMLTRGIPAKNILSTELVLDEQGKKMSKSIGNVIDPFETFKTYGADILRWYFYSASQIGKPYRLSMDELVSVRNRFFNTLWNTLRFFVVNSNKDNWSPPKHGRQDTPSILDQWIQSKMQKLIQIVTQALDNYDPYTASKHIEEYVINDFSQWYIRRNRETVSPANKDARAKNSFYQTTYQQLIVLSQLLAPFTPFLAEYMHRALTDEPSVHLTDWPQYNHTLRNTGVETDMQTVRTIVEHGHAARKRLGIKVRQPLGTLTITAQELPRLTDGAFGEMIQRELNVKRIVVNKKGTDLTVHFDTIITPALRAEGQARELIRQIQVARKKAGCELTERITVIAPDWPGEFAEMIKEQTLTADLHKGGTFAIKRA